MKKNFSKKRKEKLFERKEKKRKTFLFEILFYVLTNVIELEKQKTKTKTKKHSASQKTITGFQTGFIKIFTAKSTSSSTNPEWGFVLKAWDLILFTISGGPQRRSISSNATQPST
jgi:hypothetical protein